MLIVLATVADNTRAEKAGPEALLVASYQRRTQHYTACRLQTFRSEDLLLAAVAQARRQRAARLVLLDSGGEMLSSEEFARELGRMRDGGVQEMWVAVGPADGWTGDTLARADLRLSLGPITLPHRLAQVVVAEQVYRALAILAGHPYHSGH